MTISSLRIAFFTLLTGVLLSSCASTRSAELQLTYLTFPPKSEAAIGQEFAEKLESEDVDIVQDAAVQAWVQRLGDSLVAHSPETAQKFTFQVTTSDQVNAFAIPGGFCYVNKGLIDLAENEAQVAAVVGHEINHVTRRHGMRSLQRQMGLSALTELGSLDPRSAAAVQIISQAGGVVAMRSFGREDEREADHYGVLAMAGAGFDPREAARFFELMQQSAGGSGNSTLATLLSTHPATNERIQNIKAMVAEMKLSDDLKKDSQEFQQIKSRI